MKRKMISEPMSPRKKHHPDLSDSNLELRFEQARRQYYKSGFSQDVKLLINRLAVGCLVSLEIKPKKLLKMLIDCVFYLHLNELEIALWAIILDQAVLPAKNESLFWSLLFSGYATKNYLNTDIVYLDFWLSNKFEDFQAKYTQWITQKETLIDFNAKDVNEKFNLLSTPPPPESCEAPNYNVYVEKILYNSPGSSIERSTALRRKQETLSSPESSSGLSHCSEESQMIDDEELIEQLMESQNK